MYINIPQKSLLQTLKNHHIKKWDFTFQQDNDFKHTSKMITEWLNEHDFVVMLWPAQSADLNLIEHLWKYIKDRLKKYSTFVKDILKLWERVQKEWFEIPDKVCHNLVESMSKRVDAVITGFFICLDTRALVTFCHFNLLKTKKSSYLTKF